jgi:arsenate reductase
MAIKVYQYPKCSTCRKALKWLDAKNVSYDSVDITVTPPKKADLQRALKSGIPLKKLFNTSGQSYRDGKWGERLASTTESQALDALASDGKLVKRPFIVTDSGVTVGFDEAVFKNTYK